MFKKINEWRKRKLEENAAKLKELKAKPIHGINFKLQGVDFVVSGLDGIAVMSGMRKKSKKLISVKNLLTGKRHMIQANLIKTYVDVTYDPITGEYN